MNNKKYGLILSIVFLLIIITVGFTIYNDRTISTITLDINPSIKINLGRNEKVKSIVPLNKDAKEIVNGNFKGKSLDNVLVSITNKIIEKGYVNENNTIEIIVYSSGSVSNESIKHILEKDFGEKQVSPNITVIESITSEDEKLAKKYGITPAKASYISTIIKDNENIDFKALSDKSVRELSVTKQTGKYCDFGYTLEGDFCTKEISRETADYGKVCPNGYYEHEGICYEDIIAIEIDVYECNGDLTLTSDNKCVGKIYEDAISNFTCEKGDLIPRGSARYRNFRDSGDRDQLVCEDKSNAVAPTLRCLTNPGHIMIGGKCANGPAPTINGGCPNGDSVVNGGCYSIDDEDQWVCPDGNIYEKSKGSYEELCPDTFKYTIAIGNYSCSDGYILEGNKCTKQYEEPARNKRICPSGYSMLDNGRCINYSNTKEKLDGNVCNKENSRLEGNVCVLLEIIDARQN